MRRLIAVLCISGFMLAACSSGDTTSALTSDAGADFTVAVGEAPVFDGCGSTGEISNYAWTIVDAPDGQADADGKELRTIMTDCDFQLENAMILDDVGDWTIELVVTNDDSEASDEVVVTVTE